MLYRVKASIFNEATMNKLLTGIIAALLSLPVAAQFSSDGYYRVQNYSTKRYIAIEDSHGGQRGAQVDVASIVGYGYQKGVDAYGDPILHDDASRFAVVESNPATIIYFKKAGGSNYDFYGQGIDTYSLTSAHLTVEGSSVPGTYWAHGQAYGMTLYLGDAAPDNWDLTLPEGSPIATYGNGNSAYSKWYIKPVSNKDGFYFGMKPTVSIGNDHYLSFYVSYPFSFAGSGMHAYYVSQVDKQLGVAVYKEINGNVPQSTPVFVKCASTAPANNKLNFLTPGSVAELSGNLLRGTYFDCAKSYYHMNFVEYKPETMRVLGITKSGKIGMIKKPKEEMSHHPNAKHYDSSGNETGNWDLYTIPANTAYLYVSTDTPDDLVLMSEAEYEAYKQTASSVTIKANDASRLYGDPNPTFTYTVTSGTKNGGEPALSCTAVVTSPVGTYPIKVEKGAVTNATFTGIDGTLTVNKAPLTVTARSYTIKQNEALPTFAADFSGFKNGETSAVLTKQPTFSCNAPADKKPGTYTITVSGTEAGNYSITHVNGTLTILEADPITVTAKDAVMVYGDDVPQLTYEVTGGMLNGTPKLVCSASKTSDVGQYDITVDVSGIDYPNLKTVGAKLTINQAPVTVTAKSYTIVETDALPSYEATYNGFKNGQDASVLTTQPTLTCNVPADKTPGSYDINVSGAAAKNYSFNYVKGTLTITPAPTITIKAVAKTMVYGDAVPELTYTVEGGEIAGKPEITCSATSRSDVGEYDIVVSKGTVDYPRLAFVNAKLTINKAMLTVSAGTYTMKQTDPRPEFKASYSGWKNDDTEAVLTKQPDFATTAPADNAPGTYDVTVSGAEAKNYAFTYVPGKLIITTADAISITVEDATMVYGDAVPEFKVTISGEVDGTPKITCEATSNSPVGEYVIKVEKGTITYPNVVLINGKLTVTPAPLTIKAGEYTMKQTDPRPEFKATFEGFKNNETEAVLTKQPVLATNAPDDNKPGEYEVTVSGAEASNYTISYVNGKLTIAAAELITITVNDTVMAYGDEVPAFTYKVEGGTITGEPVITCEADSRSNAGTYTIKIAAGTITYPQLKLVDGTLTITKAPLTVSVGNYERFKGEENPVFVLEYDGWKNGDNEAVLTKKPVATCEATPESEQGEYTITISGGEAVNYSFVYVSGKLLVKDGEGIAAVMNLSRPVDVYTLTGRKVRTQTTTLQGLPAGVYVVNGQKLIVK